MGALVDQANNQAGQIRACRDALRDAQRDMDTYVQRLMAGWKGPEIQWVEQAVADLKRDIAFVLSATEYADSTLTRTAIQIEEERRQAELAALARAEQERQANMHK